MYFVGYENEDKCTVLLDIKQAFIYHIYD